jgi:serine/threonine protein kinase
VKQRERRLILNYECLQTMPTGMREVRVWWDPDLANWLVGKRVDLSEVENGADLVEPQVMEMIDHPNVVKVRSVATVAGYQAPMRVVEVLMPYYEEGSVTDALEAGKCFTPSQALRIIRAALQGLAEMHERHGILHRDVKSPNLFLTGDAQTVKLGDLGLAGKMDGDGRTPGVNAPQLYSPPEHGPLTCTPWVWCSWSFCGASSTTTRTRERTPSTPWPRESHRCARKTSYCPSGCAGRCAKSSRRPWTPIRPAASRRPAR